MLPPTGTGGIGVGADAIGAKVVPLLPASGPIVVFCVVGAGSLVSTSEATVVVGVVCAGSLAPAFSQVVWLSTDSNFLQDLKDVHC